MTKKIILFGAGAKGCEALAFFGYENVHCFVDNYEFGKEFCEKNVISFGELLKIYHEFRIVISTELYRDELSKLLQEFNIPFGVYTSPIILLMVLTLLKDCLMIGHIA